MVLLHLFALASCFLSAHSQSPPQPPSSFPHDYPGKPSGDFNPTWQNYFRVVDPLPNITFPVQQSYAGNIPVNRAGHPNNTLFFVGFEKSNGSLTAAPGADKDSPWGIWLNGGPGSSSMYGLLFENGPMRLDIEDYSAAPNNHSWSNLIDYFWIDQPVGVGYSTADADGYVHDEDQMGADFMGFLENLVKVFPSLRERPLILTGESYAGTYIPYIMKTYFNMKNPPVKVSKFVIGDGTLNTPQVFELLPALQILETYPQLIGYNQDVFKYFESQTHLCHYDVNLTYPQQSVLPFIPLVNPTQRALPFLSLFERNSFGFLHSLARRAAEISSESEVDRRDIFKRDASDFLKDRPFDQLDPWYGCILLMMYVDYAVNYTFPWNLTDGPAVLSFNPYDVADARIPPQIGDGSVFLNDDRTRKALHAPTSKKWAMQFPFVFGDPTASDLSPEPMTFLTDLATNASEQNIGVVLFSANNDGLVAHRGTEVTIQNTTFGGIQGFTRKPATPWHGDSGKFAGIVHQERNWTYVLFDNVGHTVPTDNPEHAFVFFRDFVIGSNQTGLVVSDENGQVNVIGGEDPALLASDFLPGRDEIIYGSGETISTFVHPEATRSAWNAFITAETRTTNGEFNTDNGAVDGRSSWFTWTFFIVVTVSSVYVL
ncbi:hypothetical protein Agabi119p4_6349 [Agaricus bisporus var. burnettii]|uniref:Carboxypeptidase n=1 Tax=Agaricus bisporus var. burnettii TaxID=192524 RepID=A0A8H7C8U6_AGABI|nr:hypothetical protein Agabi119p4_6349 [Agaricus bisporus var. burnettii]